MTYLLFNELQFVKSNRFGSKFILFYETMVVENDWRVISLLEQCVCASTLICVGEKRHRQRTKWPLVLFPTCARRRIAHRCVFGIRGPTTTALIVCKWTINARDRHCSTANSLRHYITSANHFLLAKIICNTAARNSPLL
jgi:hypothetical protein